MMYNPLKVFILYARFGDGHWQAASALRQSFAKLGNVEVKLVDLLEESHPVLNGVSRFVYRKSYSVLPQAYGWVYQRTKTMKPDSMFASWLHSFGVPALLKMVEKERPDAIVHTFPTLACPQVMHKMRRKIPMYNVITDFDLHLRWVHPAIDKYYVATDDMRRQLCELGIEPHRVAATGIPIRPEFQTLSAGTAFPVGRPTILVMASAGMAPVHAASLCRPSDAPLASSSYAAATGRFVKRSRLSSGVIPTLRFSVTWSEYRIGWPSPPASSRSPAG